jgi:hypothetical protein
LVVAGNTRKQVGDALGDLLELGLVLVEHILHATRRRFGEGLRPFLRTA